jgi:hypothetical protein
MKLKTIKILIKRPRKKNKNKNKKNKDQIEKHNILQIVIERLN